MRKHKFLGFKNEALEVEAS